MIPLTYMAMKTEKRIPGKDEWENSKIAEGKDGAGARSR